MVTALFSDPAMVRKALLVSLGLPLSGGAAGPAILENLPRRAQLVAVVACKMMRSAKVPTSASSACPPSYTLRCLELSWGRGEEAWLGLVAEQALDRHLVCLGYQDAKERAKRGPSLLLLLLSMDHRPLHPWPPLWLLGSRPGPHRLPRHPPHQRDGRTAPRAPPCCPPCSAMEQQVPERSCFKLPREQEEEAKVYVAPPPPPRPPSPQ